jgi:anti-anti-sigma regulatory factor
MPLRSIYSTESADQLDEAMKQVGDAKKVVLIFDEKCFINSTGLSALFEHILPGIEQGKEFRVVHPAPHFRKVFDIVGLSSDVEVFADEASALAK